RTDHARGLFQPHVGGEPARKFLRVVLPPAGSVGLSDHLQKSTAFGIVDDAVEREQVLDITCLESDAPELHPADLGLGGADVESGLVAREPALLAQAQQARTEHDAPYGR